MKIISKIALISLLAGMVVATGCGDAPAPQAQPSAVESTGVQPSEVKTDGSAGSTNISLPGGINIQTGEGGAKVDLPGIKIDTTEAGSKVSLPGVEVTTEGDKATVNMPGMTVTGNGETGNVDMGGVKVNTDGTNSTVTVGDMKIDVKDGETSIETPETPAVTDTDSE